MVRSLRALVAQGIPVVLASRSHPGIVQEAFPGIAGASHQLLHKGFLGGGALDGVLVRVRLLVALGARPRVPLADVFRNQSQGVGTELGGY
jgi:L-asparaginase/Glu-tRNA(Gln) amidotransferase subunit D